MPVVRTFMRPETADYAKYKHEARAEIAARGYSVLLTIGDQFADISIRDPPPEMNDGGTYVGQIADGYQFGIKLPSEFVALEDDTE
jgi:hypothetical protein